MTICESVTFRVILDTPDAKYSAIHWYINHSGDEFGVFFFKTKDIQLLEKTGKLLHPLMKNFALDLEREENGD